MSHPDLLRLHAAARYVLDENGDLVSTNDTYKPDRRRAPTFFVGWSVEDYGCWFRYDIPESLRREVEDVVSGNWPFPNARDLPDRVRIESIVSDYAAEGKTILIAGEGLPAKLRLMQYAVDFSIS